MSVTPLARIGRMSAAFAASNVTRSGIGFVTSLAIARGLGADGFGRWTLAAAWAATLTSLLDLGLGVLLTRDAARDESRTGDLIGGALTARFALIVPLTVSFVAAGTRLRVDARLAMAIAALAASSALYGSVGSIFRAWPRWLVTILTLEAFVAALQCAGAIWIISAGGGVRALLQLAAALQALQLAAALMLWRRAAPRSDRLEWPTWRTSIDLVRRAFPFALTGLVANAQLRVAPLLLGALSSAGEVALFGVAAKFGALVRMMPAAVFAGAMPVFASEAARGDADTVRTRFDTILNPMVVAAAAVLALAAGPLVTIAYGRRFAPAAPVLVWIALGLVPFVANSSRRVFLYASGRERIALKWSAVALAIQAAGCAALIPLFGARGAAAAVVLGEAVVWLPLRRADRRTLSGTRRDTRLRTPPSSSRRHAPAPSGALPLPAVDAGLDLPAEAG